MKIDGAEFSTSIIGFFTGGVTLLFVYLLDEENIGAGDVKLIAVVGYYIGSDKILELLFLSFMTAGIFCIVYAATLLLFGLKKEEKAQIPFINKLKHSCSVRESSILSDKLICFMKIISLWRFVSKKVAKCLKIL